MIKLDIKPNCARYFNFHLQCWLRLEDELRALGIIFTDGPGDIKLVQGSRDVDYVRRVLDDDKPTILHDLYLGPEINWWNLREFLIRDNVKAMMKTSKFVDPLDYDKEFYCYKKHVAIMADREPTLMRQPRVSHLSDKIHVFANLISWEHFQRPIYQKLPFVLDQQKELDISMMLGDIGEFYPDAETRLHRQVAVNTVCDLRDRYNVRVRIPSSDTFVDFQEYFDIMTRSKVCLSPWGYDITCFRDFEAALVGAVLIKPDTSFAVSWPDIPYVVCKTDFSDLEKILADILANYPEYDEMRVLAFQNAMKGRDKKYLAKRFADIIKSVL